MNIHKGDYKMVERIKNKKGFTIIEIMVVIALIGILAAVLVPKFTGVKETAKNAGMLTNAKTVEAYVASVIDSYPVDADGQDDLVSAIEGQFDDTDALVNPYTGVADGLDVSEGSGYYAGTGADAPKAGVIYVVVDDSLDTYISGYNAKVAVIPATKRTIER